MKKKKDTNKKLDSLLSAIVPLIEKAGGSKVYVEYNGCGDCGTAEFQHVENKKGKVVDSEKYEELTTKFMKTASHWENNSWVEKTEEAEQSLTDLAEEIAYEMLLNNASGWEINAGSYGGVFIETSPPRITLDHTPCEDEEDEDGNTETVDLDEEVYFYPAE